MAVVGALVSVAIMLGTVANVTYRRVHGGSIPGIIELVQTFMVIVVFLGLSQAEASGAHVRMNLVTQVLPGRVRRVVKAAGMGICAIMSAWMAVASTARAIDSTISGELRPGILYFPVWPARILMAVGFILLVFEYAVRVREELLAGSTDAGNPSGSDATINDEI